MRGKNWKSLRETHPQFSDIVVIKSDLDNYSYGSANKIDFICPNCGTIIKNKTINTVVRFGLSCPSCGDGISYPNKMLYNLFLQLGVKLITEYSPDWIKPKRYDGYFEFCGVKYIVEMDGGLGHGRKVFSNSKISVEKSIKIDNFKTQKAIENGYEVIRINCVPSDKFTVCQNITNSKLGELFNLSEVDWDNMDLLSQKSKLLEACTMYNNGIIDPNVIAEQIGVGSSSVRYYLNKGTSLNLCNYDNMVLRKINSHINSGSFNPVAIFCLTTHEKFESLAAAERKYKIKTGNIGLCCRGARKYAGTHPDNYLPLVWMYYDDYIRSTPDQIAKKLDIKLTKGVNLPVICITTNKIFRSLQKAADEYGLKTCKYIKKCCNGEVDYYGTYMGKKLRWLFYTDYISIKAISRNDNTYKVICSEKDMIINL